MLYPVSDTPLLLVYDNKKTTNRFPLYHSTIFVKPKGYFCNSFNVFRKNGNQKLCNDSENDFKFQKCSALWVNIILYTVICILCLGQRFNFVLNIFLLILDLHRRH